VKIFVSWSGALSQAVAAHLKEWLPLVVPFVKPYVSAEDIEKGARWSGDIASQLQSCAFGILCITHENMDAPWIHFEAGALSKTLETARVCPLLFGMRPAELNSGPLLQFQATVFDRDDVRKLVKTIARAGQAGEAPFLDKQFDNWWPQLQSDVEAAISAHAALPVDQPTETGPSLDGMVAEILERVRENDRRVLSQPTATVEADSPLRMPRRSTKRWWISRLESLQTLLDLADTIADSSSRGERDYVTKEIRRNLAHVRSRLEYLDDGSMRTIARADTTLKRLDKRASKTSA